MKLKMDPTQNPTAGERLNLMTIRAGEVQRIVKELADFGAVYQTDGMLIEMADRHLLNCLEVLKGIKFGRA